MQCRTKDVIRKCKRIDEKYGGGGKDSRTRICRRYRRAARETWCYIVDEHFYDESFCQLTYFSCLVHQMLWLAFSLQIFSRCFYLGPSYILDCIAWSSGYQLKTTTMIYGTIIPLRAVCDGSRTLSNSLRGVFNIGNQPYLFIASLERLVLCLNSMALHQYILPTTHIDSSLLTKLSSLKSLPSKKHGSSLCGIEKLTWTHFD